MPIDPRMIKWDEMPKGIDPRMVRWSSDPPVQETFDPTDGMSGLDKARAGFGKAFVDIGRGAGQMLGLVSQEDVDAAKALDAPLIKTGAGMAGNVAGNVAAIIPAAMIPGANTMAGASALGATTAALQPIASGESRIQNAALGGVFGATGQGMANTIGRIARPVQATLDPASSKLAGQAQKLGMPLNAAQLTGSKPLRWIDSALDNLPITAEKQAAMKLGQRGAWQRALLDRVGENADNASADVMGAAKDRIGKEFTDLSARNSVTLDSKAMSAISKVEAENAKAGPLASSKVGEVTKWLRELASPKGSPILGPNGKPIPLPPSPIAGKTYQEVRSILTKESGDAFRSSNSRLGQSLKELRNSLDDAATRSISKSDATAWNKAREQWGTLKAIEKSVDPNTGTISPKKLINELTRKNPNAMIYGKGNQELPDLARIGKQFVAENLPDSGTAQRSWYMNMLQNPTSGLGGALGFLSGGPVGAGVGVAAGAATPIAAQKALWSEAGKRYFGTGIQPIVNAMPLINVGATSVPLGLLNSR